MSFIVHKIDGVRYHRASAKMVCIWAGLHHGSLVFLNKNSYSVAALRLITPEEICSAAELDMKCNSDISSLEKMAFRVSLVTGFVVKFIDTIDHVGTKRNATEFKFHQLYEKTPDDQEPMDPVTRPIPHVSAAEQCSGSIMIY